MGVCFLQANSKTTGQRGFTLVEVAIGLIIIGILSAPAIQAYNLYRIEAIKSKTTGNFLVVQTALKKFAYRNGRYPKPASRSANMNPAVVTTPSAGAEFTGTINACVPNQLTVCRTTAGAWTAVTPKNVLIGAVPYAELGIPSQYAVDGYGNKITYAVTEIETSATTFDDSKGVIQVLDKNGNPVTDSSGATGNRMQYILVGHGPDKKGAFTMTGQLPVPCPTIASSIDDTNCNNDATFSANYDAAIGATLINTPSGTNHYDDFTKYLATTTGAFWQRNNKPESDIYAQGVKVSIGSVYDPIATLDVWGDTALPGNLKTDRFIVNRLCDTTEGAAITTTPLPPGSPTKGCDGGDPTILTGLSPSPSSSIIYGKTTTGQAAFAPGIISDIHPDANADKKGGGIACSGGFSSTGSFVAMSGISKSDEVCATFVLPGAITATASCTGTGQVPTGIDSTGKITCTAAYPP